MSYHHRHPRSFRFAAAVAISLAAGTASVTPSPALAADPVELPIGETRAAALAFSPDGKLLAVGTNGRPSGAKLFDVATRKEARDLPCEGRGAGFSVAFSPDGKLLAVGDYDLAVTVRNVADGAEVASLPGDPERRKYRQARGVAFSPDGKRLAVGYSSGEVFVWDLASKTVAVKFDHGNSIDALAYSPDGKLIATGTSYGLRLWNAADGKQVVALDQTGSGKHEVKAIAFLPDGKTVVTADSPGFVRFFSAEDGKELRSFKMPAVGRETTIQGLAVNPDGKTVIAPGSLPAERQGFLDPGLVLLDAETAKPKALLKGPDGVRVIAVSPNGKTVAVGTKESGDPVALYELSAAEAVKQ
jgi:WD40 repeat protein